MWGVIFMVPKGAWLDSGLKKDVHHTGGHLGRKSGDQSDLHFDNLDIRRIIVKWGVMLMVSKDAWLDSRLKKDVHHTGGQLGKKWRQKWTPFLPWECKAQYCLVSSMVVLKGAWLKSGFKNYLEHNRGNLSKNFGGQTYLHVLLYTGKYPVESLKYNPLDCIAP